MRDSFGNAIHEGSLVYWKKHDMVYRVVKVDDPADKRITVVGSKNPDPNQAREIRVALLLEVPIVALPKQDGQVEQWICVIDPAAQQVVEDALDKSKQARPQ